MMLLGFLCEKNILARLKGKTIFVLMCIVMKTKWFLNLHFRSKILKLNGFVACNLWKQVTLRIHQRFGQIYVSQNKTKTKNTFAKVICSVLSVKCVLLVKHKKLFLSINGAQSVRLEQGTIKFKSYFKQIPVQCKMYAEFECNLESVKSYEGSYSKKYQDYIPCFLAYKLVCVNDKFT